MIAIFKGGGVFDLDGWLLVIEGFDFETVLEFHYFFGFLDLQGHLLELGVEILTLFLKKASFLPLCHE